MKTGSRLTFLAGLLLAFGTDAALAHPYKCTTAITSNFNGTAIAAGNYVWFNAVVKVSGLNASPATVFVTHATITFTANGKTYLLPVPPSEITFDTSTTEATTDFEILSKEIGSPLGWDNDLQFSGLAGNDFLGALKARVPAGGLPGGIKNVVWQVTFSSNTSGLTVNWQWAAAVYTSFGMDYNSLGVIQWMTTRPVSTRTRITLELQRTSRHLSLEEREVEAGRTSQARTVGRGAAL